MGTVDEVLATARKLGHKKLLVIGGGKTNGSFLTAGVVGRLMIDVHPLLLGKGKRLCGDYTAELDLQIESVKQEPDFFCLTYRVVKNNTVDA